MNNTLIILNPWAGRGLAGKHRGDIERAFTQAGIDFDLILTHTRGGAIELAWRNIERGYSRIVAVGGDGTLNEVVNGIKGAEAANKKRVPLGIIPFGTGSDFIKAVETIRPNDIQGAVERILAGTTRDVDLGLVRVNGDEPRYYINALGIGLDAQAAAEALKIKRLKGAAVYYMAILRAVLHYRAHPMTITFNRTKIERSLLFVSVANGRCQAGDFWLTPTAKIDDGQLDLCLVDNLRMDQIARYIPLVRRGKHTKLKVVTMGRAKSVQISCSAPMPVAADGEVLGTGARRVRVEIVKHGLTIFA